MMLFLLKSSIILILFWVFHKLLLEQETYYRANRFFLLAGLCLAVIIPQLRLPEAVSDQNNIHQIWSKAPLLDQTYISDHNPGEMIPGIMQEPTKEFKEIEETANWQQWLLYIYLFGVVILAINLFAQIWVLSRKIIMSKDFIKDGFANIINCPPGQEPCSFFHYILIDPTRYDVDTYEQIIAHEKIHVQKKHTLDLLFSELMVILLWFNPWAWWYRKEIEKNLEFETDKALLTENKYDAQNYQRSLLEIAVLSKPLVVTTNYNQSLLKNRIMKMNAKESHAFNYWKYLFAAPLILVLFLVLGRPYDAMAQPMENNKEQSDAAISNDCQRLLRAVKANNTKLVQELLQNIDPDCSYYHDGEPRSALVAAARQGNLEIGQLLIDAKADLEYHARGDETPLMAASGRGHLEFVKLLVGKGATIDKVVKGDGTALINAVRGGDLAIVELLLQEGADPYLNVPGDEYAMYHARSSGNKKMVELLLKYAENN